MNWNCSALFCSRTELWMKLCCNSSYLRTVHPLLVLVLVCRSNAVSACRSIQTIRYKVKNERLLRRHNDMPVVSFYGLKRLKYIVLSTINNITF